MNAGVQQIIRALLVCPWLGTALGFGPAGHDVVGDIAERRLCQQARTTISELLDGDSLAYASRWPDWIRRTPQWSHTAPWHYINVNDDERLEAVVGRPGGDVVAITRRHLERLANERLSPAQRGQSLRFAAHFLADIHQPLHVGRAVDRGGNKVALRLNGESTNLHALWDAQHLLRSYGLERSALSRHLAAQIRGNEAAWRGGDPLSWAQESKALRPLVYGGIVGRRPVLADGDRYLSTARDIVSERLAQAGVRLADSLNSIFCNDF